MAYVTANDIEERLGTAAYIQLTDDSGSGAADPDKVEEARLAAEGEANSYLARRYAVPVDVLAHPDVAATLKAFVLDLVEYRLHNRRPPVPADLVRRHDEAVQWLRRVADGFVHLPAAQAPQSNPALGMTAGAVGPERMFSRETLGDI